MEASVSNDGRSASNPSSRVLIFERVMIERIEKEDIETQIYKDIFITNDNDGKIRERRSLTPNLHRHLNHTT